MTDFKEKEKMGTIDFFRTSIKHLKTVGTITRSSKFLCKDMIKHVDFSKARSIVELGAGDGVITKHILKAMHPDAKLLTFEILPKMFDQLNAIGDDRMYAIQDSAEKIGEYLEKHDMGEADFIISAIPFVAFPEELTYKILNECKTHLKKDGKYIQVHYSLLTKKIYQEIFGNVDVSFTPLNVPPAFVLVSEKK